MTEPMPESGTDLPVDTETAETSAQAADAAGEAAAGAREAHAEHGRARRPRVLEEGGLIRRDSSRRLQACLPRYNKLATRLSRALILHEVTFRELFEASMTLEVASVEGAVERATEENIAELAGNLERSADVVGNPAELAELDAEFHVLMAKASQNRVLQLAREPAV